MSQLQKLALSRAKLNKESKSIDFTSIETNNSNANKFNNSLKSLQLGHISKLSKEETSEKTIGKGLQNTNTKLSLLAGKIGKNNTNSDSNNKLGHKLQSLRLQRKKLAKEDTETENKALSDTNNAEIKDSNTGYDTNHNEPNKISTSETSKSSSSVNDSILHTLKKFQKDFDTFDAKFSDQAHYLNIVKFNKYDNKHNSAINTRLFSVYRPKKIEKFSQVIRNFNEPSPDDVILIAQDKVFNQTTSKLNELHLNNENKNMEPPEPVQINPKLIPQDLNVVILGHKNSGKSTFLGCLIEQLKIINIDQIRQLKNKWERFMLNRSKNHDDNQVDNDNSGISTQSNWLTWLTDLTESERTNGYSLNMNSIRFPMDQESKKFINFAIANDNNTNNKLNYANKLISKLNESDIAIMIIDCSQGFFEQGFNLNGSTIQHSILAKYCNTKKLYIMLNKMDTVDWYQDRYVEICQQLELFYQNLGFSNDQLVFIPCCSINGLGIMQRVTNNLINWYDGPSLWEYLQMETTENLDLENRLNEPLSFYIDQVNKITDDRFFNVVGHIDSGILKTNELVKLYPMNQKFLIHSVKVINNSNVYDLKLPPILRQWAVKGETATVKLIQWPHDSDLLSEETFKTFYQMKVGNLITQMNTQVVVWEGKLLKLQILDQFEKKLRISGKFNFTFLGQHDNIIIKILKIHNQMEHNANIIECEIMNSEIDIPFISNMEQIGIIKQGKSTIARVKLID